MKTKIQRGDAEAQRSEAGSQTSDIGPLTSASLRLCASALNPEKNGGATRV
jgi:hypothetical protein